MLTKQCIIFLNDLLNVLITKQTYKIAMISHINSLPSILPRKWEYITSAAYAAAKWLKCHWEALIPLPSTLDDRTQRVKIYLCLYS